LGGRNVKPVLAKKWGGAGANSIIRLRKRRQNIVVGSKQRGEKYKSKRKKKRTKRGCESGRETDSRTVQTKKKMNLLAEEEGQDEPQRGDRWTRKK